MITSIAAIHVAKRQLGLDDDSYRAKLANITGKSSIKDMTEDERQRVLQVFRSEGFVPASAAKRRNGKAKLTGKYAKKLQALWIAGFNLGVFRERDDAALIAFVKRQTGLDAVQFLHHADDARKAVEALKAILARDGGVAWKRDQPGVNISDGQRIAEAQFRVLYPNGGNFWSCVWSICCIPFDCHVSPERWIMVMNHFGKLIRERKAGR